MKQFSVFFLVLGVSTIASAVSCPSGYTYYNTVTIDHTKVSTADANQSNFPMLFSTTTVALSTVTGSGGRIQNATGYDIVFSTTTDGTFQLAYDTETYTAATGKLEYWIKIPIISSTTDTVFYIFYDNPGVSTFQGNMTGTWDSNFKAVYHLKNGTTLDLVDATSNANNGTNHSATATTGQIDGASHTTAASSQYMDMGAGSSLAITGAITIEGWINLDSVTSFPRFLGREQFASAIGYTVFYGGSPANFTMRIYTGSTSSDITTNGTLATGTWGYFVGTEDASKNAVVYLNGAQDNTATMLSLPTDGANSLLLGARNDFASTRFLDGKMDEVRISATNRSAGWIKTSYNTQSSPSTFFSYGTETSCSAAVVVPPGNIRGLSIQGGKTTIRGGKVTVL